MRETDFGHCRQLREGDVVTKMIFDVIEDTAQAKRCESSLAGQARRSGLKPGQLNGEHANQALAVEPLTDAWRDACQCKPICHSPNRFVLEHEARVEFGGTAGGPAGLPQQRIVEVNRHAAEAANEAGIAVRFAALLDQTQVITAAIAIDKRLGWLVARLDTAAGFSQGRPQADALRSDRTSHVLQFAVFEDFHFRVCPDTAGSALMHVCDDTYHVQSPTRSWSGRSAWRAEHEPSMAQIFEPRFATSVCTKDMDAGLQIQLDRKAKLPLSEQIRLSITRAIDSGVLAPGTRLPSWQDLAAQLGVARGTVQAAYERLSDARVIEAFGAKGTRVAPRRGAPSVQPGTPTHGHFFRSYLEMNAGPAIFQLGIPALNALPDALFARMRSSNVLKTGAFSSLVYPDPRGEFELRREIAAYLAISRNLHCVPEQVFVTSGYSSGLGLALRVLGLEGKKVWMEEPGFMVTRKALELARLESVLVPVDAEGLNVGYGIEKAADAALAIVTPGQQAPLGSTLSLRRRLQLLEWAVSRSAWIIEDDYLSELQLDGRAAPALASLGAGHRVIHIGTFSKTISPGLRLGFAVAPAELANGFSEVAATLAPAPSPIVQLATAQFMRDGHYVRRVRRLKRLYAAQRDALCQQLQTRNAEWTKAGLAILLKLPDGAPDIQIAAEAKNSGMAPSPLSAWFATPSFALRGLLLGVATATEPHVATSCNRLFEIIDRYR